MGQDTYSQSMKGFGDIMVSVEDNLMEEKPGMSYPLAERGGRGPRVLEAESPRHRHPPRRSPGVLTQFRDFAAQRP